MVPPRVLFHRVLKPSLVLMTLSWLVPTIAKGRVGPEHPRTIGATVGSVSEIDSPTKGGFGEVYWGKTLRSQDSFNFQVFLVANSLRFTHMEPPSPKHSGSINQKIQADGVGFKVKMMYHDWHLGLSASGGRLQPKGATSPRRYDVILAKASLAYGLFVTGLNQLYLNISYLQVIPEVPWPDRYDDDKFNLIVIGFGLDLFQIND